jgi:membrane protein
MPARGGVWPLIAYAALGAVALARGAPSPRRQAGVASAGRPLSPPPKRAPREAEGRREETRADSGRGRAAEAPWNIPGRGWKDILWRVYSQMNDDHLLTVAAGVVYYCLLALFPALAAFVSLYGLVADASTIDASLSSLSGLLPGGGMQILHDALQRLTAKGSTGLSLSFAVGIVVALWSANSGVKAIIDALNAVYGEEEKRGFVRLNLVSLAFTLGGIVSLGVALTVVVAAPIALGHLGLGGVSDALIRILRWPIILVLIVLGLGVVYRYGPSRREPRWQWISVGSVSAAVVWLVASALFSWYIANFGTYDATYGSLGAAIGMMVWMWISMIVILLGAQLNAEIEHQTARDTTIEGDKPMGRRGATKADTIGAEAR